MITKAQATAYLKSKGINCPRCMGDQVEGGDIDISSDIAEQECGCLDCDYEWVDIYKLIGIREYRTENTYYID